MHYGIWSLAQKECVKVEIIQILKSFVTGSTLAYLMNPLELRLKVGVIQVE